MAAKNKIEDKKITDLIPDSGNANIGTERGLRALDDSLASVGLGRSVVTDKHGRIIAGNKTVERAADRGFEDTIVVHTTGDKLVVVQRDDLDLSDADPNNDARKLAFFDNRVAELDLHWNPIQLQADKEAGIEIVDKLWSPVELEEVFSNDSSLFVDKEAKPNPRNLPIDIIYTTDELYGAAAGIACRSGWLVGCRSVQATRESHTSIFQPERWQWRFDVQFVDNNYSYYEHQKHLDIVKLLTPKYATVMDVMTKEQCKKDGIQWYSLEQILDWAEELSEYTDNVIVIPKYDCLDQIPAQYILGYSVPTSHGGTPLPPEMFKDRRVHLLGGSWKAQLAHMAVLGDDVVSLDNNYILKQARFGSFTYPDGSNGHLTEDLGITPNNHLYVSLAISLGNIGAKINELYPVKELPEIEGVTWE